MPNDALLLGGSGLGVGTEVHVQDNNSEEPEEDRHCVKNSIIVCTGANACGKVTSITKFRCSRLTFDALEHILEAGSYTPLLQLRCVYNIDVPQIALIQYMAQVSAADLR